VLQTGTVLIGVFLSTHPWFTSFSLILLQFVFMYVYYTGRVGPSFKRRGTKLRHALHDGIHPKSMEGDNAMKQTPMDETAEQTETTKREKNKRCCCCTLKTDWWEKAYQQQIEKRTKFPELTKLKKLRKKRIETLKAYDEEDRTDAQKEELVELSHKLNPKLKKWQEQRINALEHAKLQPTNTEKNELELGRLKQEIAQMEQNFETQESTKVSCCKSMASQIQAVAFARSEWLLSGHHA
jgi:hypothetical protein